MSKRISNQVNNKATRSLIFEKYNGHCAYCGSKLIDSNFTIDHIEPKYRHNNGLSGPHKIENYNPCCVSCNCSKTNLTLEKWRSEIYEKFNRLNSDHSTYKLLLRMKLITEHRKNIKFYFEKL